MKVNGKSYPIDYDSDFLESYMECRLIGSLFSSEC